MLDQLIRSAIAERAESISFPPEKQGLTAFELLNQKKEDGL